ncbi:MAG: TonB-dependent receptor [Gammaproteobacteria bacterium]|nr:TonB-dependent receptor [Gammaproteobacteria bacterium]
MSSTFRIVLALSPLCAAFSSAAQSLPAPSSAPPPTELEAVQVQGPAYDARRDDTATRIVFGTDTLRQFGDIGLVDALKRLPGITVGTGAPGRSGAVSLRGLGAGYTQILLNGQKAPAGFDLDSLTPEMVERVEILRAPTADQRAEAIAGSINIVLAAGARKDTEQLSLAWGRSNGQNTPSVSWQRNRRAGHRSSSVTATASRREFLVEETGTERVWDRQGTPIALRDTTLRAGGNRDVLSLAPSLETTLENGDILALQGVADASRFNRTTAIDWTTPLGEPLRRARYQQRTRIEVAQATGSATWTRTFEQGSAFTTKLRLGGNRERYTYREQGYAQQGQQNLEDHTDARLIVRELNSTGKYTLPGRGRHALQLGWEASEDRRDEARVQHLLPVGDDAGWISDLAFDARIRRLAVYVQDDLTLSERWSLYAGARWEQVETRSDGSGFSGIHRRDQVLSPVLQSLWKIPGTRRDQLRVALTRTYRSPTLAALIPRPYTSTNNRPLNPDERGNPALRPELATGVDLSYETAGKGGAQLSVGGYVRRISDVIRTETHLQEGRWVASPVNGGSATTWGVELDTALRLPQLITGAPDVSVRFNATANDSRVEDVPGPDNRLDEQVRFSGTLGADYPLRTGWTVGGSYTYRTGGTVQVSPGQFEISAYGRELDLYSLWSIGARSKLRLSINNALHRTLRTGQRRISEDGIEQLQRQRNASPLLRLQLELPL